MATKEDIKQLVDELPDDMLRPVYKFFQEINRLRDNPSLNIRELWNSIIEEEYILIEEEKGNSK